MSEYIKKEAVLNFIEKGLNNPDKTKSFGHDAIEIMAEVRYMPVADVVEVKHGKWKRTDDGAAYCTNCKRKMNPHCYGYAYCSLCGARMDGDTE